MNVVIDVGSTLIKGLAVQNGVVVEHRFHRYDNRSLPKQVKEVIEGLQTSASSGTVSICSSFKGGLSIGLLCLSKRVSGVAAEKALEAVGANVHYLFEWQNSSLTNRQLPVDILVVVGGIDLYPETRARKALETLDLNAFPHERLVYAGHHSLLDKVRQGWPDAEIIDNLLEKLLWPTNDRLPEFIRETYLKDLTSKREVSALQEFSAVQIEPTPAIVSRAFRKLQEHLLSPAMIFDVGGATTDIHFTSELLDEKQLPEKLGRYPAITRHVFTAYGVQVSRKSTIQRLIHDERCMYLLMACCGEDYRHVYLNLLEGKATDRLIFTSCIFLSIRDVLIGHERAPPLKLSAIATVGLTGGASICIESVDVSAALSAAIGSDVSARIVVDHDYQWWGLGLIDDEVTKNMAAAINGQ